MNERDTQGRFAPGHKSTGGRPPKAREAAYLAVFSEVVQLEDWRGVVRKALDDAQNGEDGRTRELGRRFIADYAIGKPKQTIALSNRDAYNEYAGYSDDDLRAIVATADEADAGAGAGDPGGAAAGEG